MVRAQIDVERPSEVLQVIQTLQDKPCIKLIKIKNNLTTPLQNVVINLIYTQEIIAEINVRLGSNPLNFHQDRFMANLARADTPTTFRIYVMEYLNKLSSDRKIYTQYIP